MKSSLHHTSSSNFNPLISIVIPVFNGSNYLIEAINSALNQTYKNIEILVVNDGSNDGGETERIALSYGDRIKYIQKANGGVASALNVALKEINGEYFSWLSHDDFYAPTKIEEQLNYLSRLQELDRKKVILYSDFSVFHKNLNEATLVKTEAVAIEDFTYWLAINSRLHGCTLLIPREIMIIEGGFNEELQTTQDYELWFRLALKYEFHQLKKCLLFSRLHKEQTSIVLSDTAKIEGKLLHKYFLMRLSIYNMNNHRQGNLWEKYTALTFCMLRKRYPSAFFYGLKLLFLNFPYCTLTEKRKIVVIAILEITKLPFYLFWHFLPMGVSFHVKKYLRNL